MSDLDMQTIREFLIELENVIAKTTLPIMNNTNAEMETESEMEPEIEQNGDVCITETLTEFTGQSINRLRGPDTNCFPNNETVANPV